MTEESIDAIQVIEATIRNCQKSQLKFVAGSAQFTLGSYVKNPDIKVRTNLTFNLNYLI
ncbi:hypothetical protein LCUFL03_250001 [Latilactobacillus curvatus]|uniref:hypothetical protein n=1 Tax=Latilactobacillus curvatus TaxID=28038 RepID=UPI000A1A6DE1|nr:hypothetical protein [Latilactobacillus curvatus]SMH68408.1 hypothetical protein LCUFL03_250001 [Latilactobacillus curvatus]